jgi:hypothetical protein
MLAMLLTVIGMWIIGVIRCVQVWRRGTMSSLS